MASTQYTRTIISALIIISSLLFGRVLAQSTSNSPYSYFNIGELGGMDHAQFIGIGNASIGVLDSTIINFYNPASYNQLAKNQPLFTTGISSRLSTFSENGNDYFNSLTGLQNITLAFPVMEHFGFAFGVKPFSRKGFEFSTGETLDTDSIVYNYYGQGGVNEVYLGFSSDILKIKNSRLAVGINAGYLFGESTNFRTSGVYSSSSAIAGGLERRNFHLSSFHYELGSYFQQRLGNHTIEAAFVYEPSQNLTGDYTYGLYYTANIETEAGLDTLNYFEERGSFSSAGRMKMGLTYKFLRKANDDNGFRLNSEYVLFGEYEQQNWEDFSTSFSYNIGDPINTSRISLGVQFTPEIQIFEKSTVLKFHERLKYRAGFYTRTLPYMNNGDQVSELAGTFGVGIPIMIAKSLSSVNLGFSYGNRGTQDENALRETFYGINLGITIAPGISERWFRKPKLN